MDEPPPDRCGYTYPPDYEIGSDPNHENSCYRESLPDTGICAWHAHPDKTDHKTIENLRAARAPTDIRDQNQPVAELLDGAVLAATELKDALSFVNTVLREADLSDANLTKAKLSGANLGGADLTDVRLYSADLTGAALREADLPDASLSGADLPSANLTGADLPSANLTGADLSNVHLGRSDLTDANLSGADLTDARLYRADLTDAALREADLPDANLSGANLSGANLPRADLSGVSLAGADLSGANLPMADLSDASLRDADLSDADLHKADLHGASLREADLSGANLPVADLSDAYLPEASLSGANLGQTDLSSTDLPVADLSGASLREADLSGADLHEADLSGASLREADLSDAYLAGADLSDAYLAGADLSDADLELSILIGSNLFDADLTKLTPYGARVSGVRINDGTAIHTNRTDYRSWWQRGPLAPPPRCGYDIELREREDVDDEEYEKLLSKAADTYKQFEELARDNTRPSLQSSMFVLRQDMQRKRYWVRGKYLQHAFARVSRSVFKHGESLARIFVWGLLLILGYAIIYTRFDLILNDAGSVMQSPVDAIYFSTLTFTTLGLGDFQPDPASEVARALVTTQAALGAILIAIFVFVLGRRAAR